MRKKTIKINESKLHKMVNESVKRVLKEAENYGWVVETEEAQEAYDFACDQLGKDTVDDAIVRCLGNEKLADCLAFVFRAFDFREWENRNNPEEIEDF